jgi:hypothetical protein
MMLISGNNVEGIQNLTILNDSNEPHENKPETPRRSEPPGRGLRYIQSPHSSPSTLRATGLSGLYVHLLLDRA